MAADMVGARRLSMLTVLTMVGLVACASSGHESLQRSAHRDPHAWVTITKHHSRLVGACVSGDCGPYAIAFHWSGVTIAGLTGFNILLNGSQVASVGAASTSYTYVGADCGITSTLGVQAHDAAAGVSSTYTATYTTPACPITGTAGATNCSDGGVTWCGDWTTGTSPLYQYTDAFGGDSTGTTSLSSDTYTTCTSSGNSFATYVTVGTTPLDTGTTKSSKVTSPSGVCYGSDKTSRMQYREGNAAWIEGADLYFHVSLYIASTTTIGCSGCTNPGGPWRALFSWPSSDNGSCSNGGIELYTGDANDQPTTSGGTSMLTMVGHNCTSSNAETIYWALPSPSTNAWYDFIFHRHFSSSSATGFQEMWLQKPGDTGYTQQTFNGPGYTSGGTPSDLPPAPSNTTRQSFETLCFPVSVGTGCTASDHVNMRVGDYRNPVFSTTDTFYYAGVRASSTFTGAQ